MAYVKLRPQHRAYSSPSQCTTPTKFSRNVSITYSIHYKNTCAIHGFFYKSFFISSQFPSPAFPFIYKTLTGTSDSLAQFSTLPAHQFLNHASRKAHCRLEIYGSLMVFPIHKHSISQHLFRKETFKYLSLLLS